MKRLLAGVAVATLAMALFTGCKKFLDRKPLSATVNDLQVGALEGQALGLYGAIRNSGSAPYIGDGMQNIAYLAMNGFRSDDVFLGNVLKVKKWHSG